MTSVYTTWHLNLGFSAIEDNEHVAVINSCYWPLLDLVKSDGYRFGIEVSASTLQRIKDLDPAWIDEICRLQEVGKVEILASGWSQIIAPLVPWQITEINLKLANEFYASEFSRTPKLAFLNEQVWSDGIFDIYADAGYVGVVLEWENSFFANPQWEEKWRYGPVVMEKDGRELSIIWNHSTSFQKLQRFAHGEISLSEWTKWFHASLSDTKDVSFCIYGGDVETIGYRPKRYTYETSASPVEWEKIDDAFKSLLEKGIRFVLPSELLINSVECPRINEISTLTMPLPTKKQPKYNPLRWAVGGRDSVLANTKCQRILDNLLKGNIQDLEIWRKLLELWASDFRTHITEKRWVNWLEDASRLEEPMSRSAPRRLMLKNSGVENFIIREDAYEIEISNQNIRALISKQKGLALKELNFFSISPNWLVGTFEHGASDHIEWNADFFSGEFVLEPAGHSKVSDLVPVKLDISTGENFVQLFSRIHSRLGHLEKTIRVYDSPERIVFSYKPLWKEIPSGSLRFGDVVLNSREFPLSELEFETHNGGRNLERFKVFGSPVDQGRALSSLVSARQCFGITEGYCLIGDNQKRIKVSNNQLYSKVPALLTFQNFKESYLFRLQFSGREIDDTSSDHNISLVDYPREYEVSIEPVKG